VNCQKLAAWLPAGGPKAAQPDSVLYDGRHAGLSGRRQQDIGEQVQRPQLINNTGKTGDN